MDAPSSCEAEVYKAIEHDKGKSLREREAKWLIEVCCERKPKIVLDVGTGNGVTGRIFSLTADHVYSIDKGISKYSREMIATYGREDRVTYIQSFSVDAVLPINPHSADLLFIDAGHPTLYVIADFLKFSRFVKDDGLICFHDCDRRDVVDALDVIMKKQDPRLYEGYELKPLHAVNITRAFFWRKAPDYKTADINRVDPAKAK